MIVLWAFEVNLLYWGPFFHHSRIPNECDSGHAIDSCCTSFKGPIKTTRGRVKKTPTAPSAAAGCREATKEAGRLLQTRRKGRELGWLLLPVIKVHLLWSVSVQEADTWLNNVLACCRSVEVLAGWARGCVYMCLHICMYIREKNDKVVFTCSRLFAVSLLSVWVCLCLWVHYVNLHQWRISKHSSAMVISIATLFLPGLPDMLDIIKPWHVGGVEKKFKCF